MFQEILLKALEKSDKGYACIHIHNNTSEGVSQFEIVKSSASFWSLTCSTNSDTQANSLFPELRRLLEMQIINKDGKSFVSELHIPSADRWLEVEIIPSDENYLVVILSDKTNETRHRHKSEQFQHQYKMIFDNSLLGIFRYDQFGIIMEANDAFIEILGSSREKLIGLNTTKLPDDRIRDAIQLTLKGSRERVYGKYTATTSGREVDVNSFFSPIELNEMVVGGFGIVRDVSERLRIQRELEENEYNLNYAQQLAEMGSWETTADGKQLDWSENYYRLLGLQPFSTPPDNALFFSKVHPEDIQLFTLDQSALVSNPETIEFEFRIVLDGGQIRWMKNSIHPIVENGKLVRLKGINIDITELKAVQLQLEKSLQEKDTLLSEVHHRVKNNLAIISSLLQLQTDLTDPGINQQVLLDSVSRIRSMALIHELIYRQETFSKLRVDEFMYQFISIVSDNYASSATKVETRLQTHEIQLDIDKAIPFSLITNELLTNAYKHAFKGRPDGLIVIELKSTDNEVQLKICDDGVGLGDSFRAKTGETLGTSLVYGLVEQLNGQVTFENVPSGGTCITVKFSCTE